MAVRSSCEISEPQRSPLISDVADLELPDEELSSAVNILKTTAIQHLFLWKDFSVILPQSIINVSNQPVDSVFSAPEFDECEMLSKGTDGNLKALNRHQLAQLRHTARFDVGSANFPGEVHTWKISSFFLKGTENIREAFKEDLYRALAQLVIYAHDRIVSEHFSVRCGLSAFCRDFFCMTIDLLFGWPSINHGDVDAKLMEERLRFITCELSVKSSHRKRVMDFWDAYEQLMCHPRDTFLHQTETKHPPYRFITPARIPIDLRLHNSMLLDRCLAVINGLRQPTRVGWFQDFKETTIARLRDEGKSLQEVKRLVRQDGLREYASRLFDAMRQNAALQSISDGIAEPLIQQATFSLILAEAKEAFATDWLTYQEQADQELRRTHGHLYHIAEWRQRRMGELEEQYLEAHKYDIHEMVLSKCMQSGLEQHAFFISRDLTFLRDRERLLQDQLQKSASFPDTQFIFRVPAQLLRHWRVYRRVVSYTTSYEMVDTVLLSRRPSRNEPVPPIKRSIKCAAARDPSYELINVPYARKPPRTDQEFGPQDFEVHTASPKRVFRQVDVSYLDIDGEDEAGLVSKPLLTSTVTENKSPTYPEFVVQSSLVYKVSTRYFMWRWLVFLVCTYSWLLRFGQMFLITIPFRSAFSLTALVKPGPIYLRLELDQATGYLFYNKSFYQDTIISRIIRIWRNIRASRRAFDATPSKGLLDKAAARPLHRIWSYLFRGFFSTLLILVIWPPLCLLVSSLSILLGLTLPLTVPLISLLLHFSGVLFWDAYKPASKPNRLFPIVELIFGHFLVRFLLQTILAFLAAFIFCPVWAVIRLVWAFVRCITRSIWDALVFHLVLRRLARVPAREDFMVKRIAGPGTAANHFYRARPVDILVVLVGQLELLELSLWRRQMEQLADKPIDAYRRLVQSLSWLCLTPQSDGKLYTTLCQKTKLWRSEIQSNTEERIQALQLHLKPNQLQRIKLSDRDLHHTLRMGAELTECFFQNRIAARLDLLQQDLVSWWSAFSLNTDDYLGLCTSLLGRTFGEQIFTCITENDTVFPLQVREPSLIQHFQDFLIGMVSRKTSLRSLDAVAIDKHRSAALCSSPAPPEEEVLSLSSDAVASTSDLMSQRCTVIPASPSKRNLNANLLESEKPQQESEIGSALVSSSDKGLAVSFAFPDTLRTSQRRAVPDPIAFIHIDLPLFPLSAFAPLSCRHLPLPLRSSPKLSTINPLPCFISARLEDACKCCICTTKSDIDRAHRHKLAERCGNLGHQEGLCTCTNGVDVTASYPAHSGLVEEERNLGLRASGWSARDAGIKGSLCPSLVTVQPESTHLLSRCQVHGTLTMVPEPHRSLWKHVFSCSGIQAKKPSPVVGAVEHLGRVYHPAIITLLMHARDREQNPLDLSHPAVQTAINQVTTPQRAFNLIHRLQMRSSDTRIAVADLGPPLYPVLSVGSELAREIHTTKYSSLKATGEAGSPKILPYPAVVAVSRSSVILDRGASRSLLLGSSKDFRPGHSGSLDTKSQDTKATPTDITVRRFPMNTDQSYQFATSRVDPRPNPRHINGTPLMLFGWDDPSAVVAGYWSGMDTPGNEVNDLCNSTGTPTGSLYGTEDAATTDDLDETEDALSLSSLNQGDIVENVFSGPGCNQVSLFGPADPLIVPNLLTTSATTAGSAEIELDHRADVNEKRSSLLGTAASLHLHSGQSSENCSTVINPGSCDRMQLSPETIAGSPTDHPQSKRICSHPDLLTSTVGFPESKHSQNPSSTAAEKQSSPKQIRLKDTNCESSAQNPSGYQVARLAREEEDDEDEEEDEQDTLKTVLIM
ncbi:hypothetical protein CSKR_101068 [Clonorchis sinensis]|uniref:Uncharacterized protein n=1 Tax=Clonorchis sinensis TaxID=79923 RepID=A0A8T1M3G1_CLOSI|nr:hypothetical protein CSKR_101068 [Clonorchis sinensis]